VLELKIDWFIILYKKQSEIGRIVETPAESLEKDLLNFLS
jgi:hypothetical protein